MFYYALYYCVHDMLLGFIVDVFNNGKMTMSVLMSVIMFVI